MGGRRNSKFGWVLWKLANALHPAKTRSSDIGYARTYIQGCFLLVIIYCSILFYDYCYYFILYTYIHHHFGLRVRFFFFYDRIIVVYLYIVRLYYVWPTGCATTRYAGELYYVIYCSIYIYSTI